VDNFIAALATDHRYDLNEEQETSALAENAGTKHTSSATISLPTALASPFNSLTPEILHEILLCLPYPDLQNFTLSGLSNTPLRRVQSFWKRKVLIDMPWLWDLPSPEGERDWYLIYQELRRQCFATTASEDLGDETSGSNVLDRRDTSLILGLANRRRIWTACAQLTELYLQEVKRRNGEVGEIEKESIASPTMLVGHPVDKAALSLKTCFVRSWKDIEMENEFIAYFGGDGRLVGVEIVMAERNGGEIFGSTSDKLESVIIPKDTWISRFELVLSGTQSLDAKAEVGICGMVVSPAITPYGWPFG
jgi:hypothetical protein